MSGRELYGGGEIERNQNPNYTVTTATTTSNLAFRAADHGSVYKPIMPPTLTNSDNGNPFHHVPLHHHQDMVVVGGGGGGGISVDGLNMNNHNNNNNNNNSSEPVKRKRGRPRKYSPPPQLDLTSPPQQSPLLYPCGFQSPTPSSTVAPPKKPRGRPPGSGSARQNHQHLPIVGSGGTGFTPHVIIVKAGEDVLLKIMSFSQNGPRGVCILSAFGAISNVTLRQAFTSGGTVTYKGHYEILSLSGSFLLSENGGGQRSRTGGLSVLLSGPEGVLGGGVAGLLTAASSVQIVVGSFISEESKGSKLWINQPEAMSAPGVAGSPPSRGTFSESSGGPGSPLNQSTGACNNSNPLGMPNMLGNRL